MKIHFRYSVLAASVFALVALLVPFVINADECVAQGNISEFLNSKANVVQQQDDQTCLVPCMRKIMIENDFEVDQPIVFQKNPSGVSGPSCPIFYIRGKLTGGIKPKLKASSSFIANHSGKPLIKINSDFPLTVEIYDVDIVDTPSEAVVVDSNGNTLSGMLFRHTAYESSSAAEGSLVIKDGHDNYISSCEFENQTRTPIYIQDFSHNNDVVLAAFKDLDRGIYPIKIFTGEISMPQLKEVRRETSGTFDLDAFYFENCDFMDGNAYKWRLYNVDEEDEKVSFMDSHLSDYISPTDCAIKTVSTNIGQKVAFTYAKKIDSAKFAVTEMTEIYRICPGESTTRPPCPLGYECTDGRCIAKEPEIACQSDGDCGSGFKCIDGQCLMTCATDADCTDVLRKIRACKDGLCKSVECLNNDHCAATEECKDYNCVTKAIGYCDNQDDCGPTQYCDTIRNMCMDCADANVVMAVKGECPYRSKKLAQCEGICVCEGNYMAMSNMCINPMTSTPCEIGEFFDSANQICLTGVTIPKARKGACSLIR